MERRSRLSDYERGEIGSRVAADENHKTIATAIGRDKRTVDKYVENRQAYAQKNLRGRPKKLS